MPENVCFLSYSFFMHFLAIKYLNFTNILQAIYKAINHPFLISNISEPMPLHRFLQDYIFLPLFLWFLR